MHTTAVAPARTKKLDINDCFVEDPEFWVLLRPAAVRPEIVSHKPSSREGRTLGTAYTESTARRICDEWEQQTHDRVTAHTNAMYTLAGALLVLAILVGAQHL